MATLTGTPHPGSKLSSAIDIAVVALGALVAVSVAGLFLTMTGKSRTGSLPRHQSSGYAPLIPYHIGPAPTATGPSCLRDV